jgi:hypothetical protein
MKFLNAIGLCAGLALAAPTPTSDEQVARAEVAKRASVTDV